jgi:hypothetical protein
MEPIDPQDVENSLEDCPGHQDQFMRTAGSFHVKDDDKCTRSVECAVFMITGGRIPTIVSDTFFLEIFHFFSRF